MKRAGPPPVVWSEQLLATIFHQLRTPISSINGYAALLLTGELGKLSPHQRETVERLQEICQSITNLTGNLLALTKSNRGKIQGTKEFVNLPQIISEQVSSLRGEVRRKRIRLVVSLPEGDVRFWADAGDVTQIFLNLLSNAVKFTPAGGRVELRVLRRPKELVIQVTDTGVGIAKEDLPKIFREFYYVNHPEVGATLGSGLGLSIVKRVIEAYRGRILVTSRVGHGTQFRLTLPVMAERGYMNEFLKEVWSEAKRADWAIGFLFCQMRSSGRDGSFPPRDLPRAVHELEKKLHTYFLKREDRIFHLPANSLLVVLVRTDPEDFPVTVRRLQRALEEGWAIQKFKGRGIQWRLAALRVPRMGGSPGRFLEMGRRRLRESWTKAVPV